MINNKTQKEKSVQTSGNIVEKKVNFTRHVINENAYTTNNIRAKDFDINKAIQKSDDAMAALEVNGGLQAMLASQMYSIHELQQRTMAYANSTDNLELQKYYTNSAIKLANCFVQQTNILAKLQGVAGQKIIVERVDVHHGGQAVVGNIQG